MPALDGTTSVFPVSGRPALSSGLTRQRERNRYKLANSTNARPGKHGGMRALHPYTRLSYLGSVVSRDAAERQHGKAFPTGEKRFETSVNYRQKQVRIGSASLPR